MSTYFRTSIGEWVERFFREIEISQPSELSIESICAKCSIWVYFFDMESKAINRNGLMSMVIDRRLSPEEQWEDFGHELCHLLLQEGNQLLMPTSFIQFQESKAELFKLEFCIPSFMLKEEQLPAHRNEAIAYVAQTFRVTLPTAQRRMEQWENRILHQRLEKKQHVYRLMERRYKHRAKAASICEHGESYSINPREQELDMLDHSTDSLDK